MQIDSIELFHLELPLRQPIAGRDTFETVLVKMQSGDVCGWGEANPGNAPQATAEWAGGVFACLRDWMGPLLAGKSVNSGNALQEQLDQFRDNRFAKAGLDTAWWDLHARLQKKTLHEAIGGTRKKIEVGLTLDQMESTAEFIDAVGAALDAGYARLKLKFRPGWDILMVDAVRREFPDATLHIDCEGGLDVEHIDMLCRVDDYNLAMVEQPLPADDLVGNAMVQETLRTPVCLDESITTLASAEIALDLKSCGYMNLKQGRAGGLTPAIAIHDACKEESVGCWAAATPQTAIGARATLALASLSNCEYPADHFPAEVFLGEDLAEHLLPVRAEGAERLSIAAWKEPGIGIEPDEQLLEKFTLNRATVA